MGLNYRSPFIIGTLPFVLIAGYVYALEIQYDLNSENIEKINTRVNKKVAVILFDDTRPDIERSTRARLQNLIENANAYTEDWAYLQDNLQDKKSKKDSIAKQLSKMIANHLKYSNLFKEIDFIDISSSELLYTDKNRQLKGYDLALTGKIKHYYGFYKIEGDVKNTTAGSALTFLGGAVGGAIGGGMQESELKALPKKIEGYTALTDIKLIDLNTGNTIWEGEVRNHVKDTRTKYISDMYTEAHNSLRNALNDLVKKIEKTKIE